MDNSPTRLELRPTDESSSELQNTDQGPPPRFVRVLHNFSAESPGEIDLREGDKVEVIDEHTKGWWYGRNGTRHGCFPQYFCTPVIFGYARVLTVYHPDGSAELDLNPGDVVEIHRQDSSEYWYGTIRSRIGLIKIAHCDVIDEDDMHDVNTPEGSDIGDEDEIERLEEEAYRAGIWL